MTPQIRAGGALQEARIFTEDTRRELRDAQLALEDLGADASVAAIAGILTDLGALQDRIYVLEVQWQQQGRAAA